MIKEVIVMVTLAVTRITKNDNEVDLENTRLREQIVILE